MEVVQAILGFGFMVFIAVMLPKSKKEKMRDRAYREYRK